MENIVNIVIAKDILIKKKRVEIKKSTSLNGQIWYYICTNLKRF